MSPTPLKPPALLPVGPFTTSGSQIIDSVGVSVRLCGVNWNWYNGPNSAPDMLSGPVSYQVGLQDLAVGGINTVRICTCDASIIQNRQLVANTIINPDLFGTTYNTALQTVVNYGYSIGLQFIIESHNNEGTNIINQGARNPNGLWYDVGGLSNGTDGGNNVGTITDAIFLSSWQTRAQLFANNAGVIGYDLRNEPLCFGDSNLGCSWGPYGPSATSAIEGSSVDLASMYKRVGNAILAIDSSKLIICEGPLNTTGSYLNAGPAPWGDLTAVQNYPILLNTPNRVIYSHHIFPSEVTPDVPDTGNTFQQYYATGGYLAGSSISPYFIGDCGDSMISTDATNWANMFIPWINGNNIGDNSLGFDIITQQGISWCWSNFNTVPLIGLPPQFGILDNSGSIVDPLQASYWQQMLPWAVRPLIAPFISTNARPASATPTALISGPTQVIQFLNSISGTYTISGQFVETCGADGTINGFSAIQVIQVITGFWLGLIEGDYYHADSTGNATTNFNSTAISYWNNGGLISLSLNIPNPTTGGVATDGQFCNFNNLLTPGTTTHVAWMNSLSQIAVGLQELQNAGVTVLLRIYHEPESTLFWWGTQNATSDQYVALWQSTYNYFVTTSGLNNLVWVAGGITDYSRFPGFTYVDVIGQDSFSSTPGPDYQNVYDTLTTNSNGLMYAMTEFGPNLIGFDQTVLIDAFDQTQPLTTYWTQSWNGQGMENSINLQTALLRPRVLNRGQFVLPTISPLGG